MKKGTKEVRGTLSGIQTGLDTNSATGEQSLKSRPWYGVKISGELHRTAASCAFVDRSWTTEV